MNHQQIKELLLLRMRTIYLLDMRILFLLSIILITICSYGLYQACIVDDQIRLQSEQIEESKLKEELANSSAIIKDIPAIRNKLIELEAINNLLDEKFFISNEVSSIVVSINEIADKSGLNIANIDPTTEDLLFDKSIWSRQIGITLHGDSKSLSTFIYELSKYDKIMQINEIKVNRIDDSALDINLIIKAFYLRAESV